MKTSHTSIVPLLLLLGAMSLLAACTWTGIETPKTEPLSVGDERFYALMVGDQVMGYSTFKVTDRTSDELVTEAHTLLKINFGGEVRTLDYQATAHLTPDFRPRRYRLDASEQGRQTQVEVTIGEMAQIRAIAEGETTEKEVPIGSDIRLLDNNLFDHYFYLLRSLPLAPGKSYKLSVLVPQGRTTLDVELKVGDAVETIKVGDEEFRCLVVELEGVEYPQMTLWVTAQGELVRLALPSQNFTAELADSRVIGRVRAVDIFALLAGRFTASNVLFSSFDNVTHMKAEIAVKVAAEVVDPAFLTYRGQRFQGTVEDNLVTGIVETEVVRYDGADAPLFPMPPDPTLTDYLQPEEKIEADDPDIVALAQELTAEARTAWDAAQAVADWVYRNIRYEITATGARECLRDRRGDCGPKSYLTIAMLRAVGIPARMVGGFLYANGQFGQHYWVEAHMGEAGWVPLEPTVGQYGWLDATHVRLWQKGAIETIQVKVLDYEDTGAEAVTFQRRSIAWRVGEERRYQFTVDGKDIGYNTYQVVSQEKRDGAVVYVVQSHLELDFSRLGSPNPDLSLDATLHISAELEPLEYHVEALVGTDRQTIDAVFSEGQIHSTVVARGRTHERDVTLQPGTVLLGNNMIGWFALMYRALPLEPGREFTVPAYFAENFSTMAVKLKVRDTPVAVEVGGKTYKCLIVEIPQFRGEVDYVTADGLLVRATVPGQKAVIDLVPQ